MAEIVVIEKLTKKYSDFFALNELSLKINAGVCIGYLGPNGAGKTTTIRLLTGLLRPTSGRVFVDGVGVLRRDGRGRRQGGIRNRGLDRHQRRCVGAVVRPPQIDLFRAVAQGNLDQVVGNHHLNQLADFFDFEQDTRSHAFESDQPLRTIDR